MADKMRLGRQDQGDNDIGEILFLTQFYCNICPSIWMKLKSVETMNRFHFFIQLRRESPKSPNVSRHAYPIPKSYWTLELRKR